MTRSVLHVVPYFYPAWSYGGIPRIVYGLARQQAAAGRRVTVLTTDAFGPDRRAGGRGWVQDLHGVRVIRCPNWSNALAYHHQLFLPRGAAAFLRRHAADHEVIHLHGHRHLLENLAATAADRAGLPLVMTPNGTLPVLERRQLSKRLWDLVAGDSVLARCDLFIAVSRAEVTQLRRAGISADRMALIPNGFDLAEFERPPSRGAFRRWLGIGDARVVLYLGKITPRKGVGHLIEAFARVGDERAHLVIAGNDMSGEMDGLRHLRDVLGVGRRVHFVGLLIGPRRLQALADADVLVYPSRQEIFGLVPFEGLLSGTPVVVGDDCGCGELVGRAGAGFLVPFGQVDELARRIRTLLTDREAGAMMARRGRRHVQARFSWPVVARQTDEAYERAVRRRDRRGA